MPKKISSEFWLAKYYITQVVLFIPFSFILSFISDAFEEGGALARHGTPSLPPPTPPQFAILCWGGGLPLLEEGKSNTVYYLKKYCNQSLKFEVKFYKMGKN